MSPLTALPPHALQAYGLRAREIAPAEVTALPVELQAPAGAANPSGDFSNMLGRLVQEVSAKQTHAAETVNAMRTGGNVSLHEAMITMEEANVSFQLMVEVRNKLLESYQELMRLQV